MQTVCVKYSWGIYLWDQKDSLLKHITVAQRFSVQCGWILQPHVHTFSTPKVLDLGRFKRSGRPNVVRLFYLFIYLVVRDVFFCPEAGSDWTR